MINIIDTTKIGASTNLKIALLLRAIFAEINKNPKTAMKESKVEGIKKSILPFQTFAPHTAKSDIIPTRITATSLKHLAIKSGNKNPAKPNPTAIPAPDTKNGEYKIDIGATKEK